MSKANAQSKTDSVPVDLNFEDLGEVQKVAKLYVSVPLNWEKNYQVTDDLIQKNIQWLLDNKDNLKCLFIYSSDRAIIALHILLRAQQDNSTYCSIKTLWVHDDFRNRGLASRLKALGESWAIHQQAENLIAHVMASNPLMLKINKKKGFVPARLEMQKKLI